MENLIYSMGKIKEKTPWPEPRVNGPSKPSINKEVKEVKQDPLFLHPAEKPQFNQPLYRAKLYDRL